MFKRIPKAVALVAAGTALLTAVLVAPGLAASGSDQEAIKAVIQARMDVVQGFGGTSDGTLPAADLGSSTAAVHDRLANVYTDRLLTLREKQLDDALNAQAAGQFLWYGGGTTDLEFRSLTMDGTTAVAVVRATTWSSIGQPVNGQVVTARPTNTEIFTFDLLRETQGWRITDETFDFEPGSEP